MKYIVLIFLLLGIYCRPALSQTGSAMYDAIPIVLNSCYGGVFVDYKNTSFFGDSYGNPSPNIWYSFTLSSSDYVQISSCGSDFDTYLWLLDEYGNIVVYEDDMGCGGGTSEIYQYLSAGNYYIVAEGYSYHSGNLTLTVATGGGGTASPGANMGDAIDAGTFGNTGSYTDTRSNTDDCLGDDIGQPSNDIYYRFTLTGSATVTLSHCGSAIDTYMHLLDAWGNVITFNDDDHSSNNPCPGTRSYIQATLVAGTYYVVSEGYGSYTGSITTSIMVSGSASSSAPDISYGSGQSYALNEQVSILPGNNGGAAAFQVSVLQTLSSGFSNPLNTAVKSDGTLYAANAGYHNIIQRTPLGSQSTFAGGGGSGLVNGTGTSARFKHPSFLAFDAGGNLYVADQQNHVIRKITPSGTVSTFAGSGSIGSSNGTGASASFQYPMGLAFDGAGNLFVADAYNNLIRKISPSGVVSTYAGSGTAGLVDGPLLSAQFNQPMGLHFDNNGDLYVVDRLNRALRKISGSTVSTVAGNGSAGNVDGIGSAARFHGNNLVVERSNVYIVDQTYSAIKHISPSGEVKTISAAGQFTTPYGISQGPDGSFYVTENTLDRIKQVSILPAYSISPALPASFTFDRNTGEIKGSSSTAIASASYTVTARNGAGTSTATVTFGVGDTPAIPGFEGSSDQNYIIETTARQALASSAAIQTGTIAEVNRTIQYFDGLGRPMQSVQWQASPTNKDIVQHIAYDGLGRESKKYLPYAAQSSDDASYKTDASTSQQAYYGATGSWDSHVVKTPTPYAETVFENSPLNRVLEQGAPGDAWQPASGRGTTGRTVVTEYGTNTGNDVRLWQVNSTNTGATGTGYYAAGKLYKTVVKDENWTSGKSGTVEEFKDFENRVVLKRVWKSETEALNTYYVYDYFGDLRYVIPPGYTGATLTDDEATFNEQIYAYRYDVRRRVIEKKLPGKGWEYLVYNRNDQLVLTQDAEQRQSHKWSYTKYDAFARVVETGIYTNMAIGSRSVAQDSVEGHILGSVAYQWEERIGTPDHSNRSFPTSVGRKPYVVNYYDDYTFSGGGGLSEQGITKSLKVKTLLTGMLVSKDDGTLPLLTVNYYDDRARLIQSVSQNHLGGTDRITNTYTFVGELETSKREHTSSPGGTVTTVLTTNAYDHVGRLVSTKHKVNSQGEVTLTQNGYNEIGQLKSKAVGAGVNGTAPLATVSYTYNERGWTKSAGSDFFSYELRYNAPANGAAAQYNGNISEHQWSRPGTAAKYFTYSYDPINRLTQGNSPSYMTEQLQYDDMGNITSLYRADNYTSGTIGYSYTGNRLQSVSNALSVSYIYDLNGNATQDRTGMAIGYNHLNLPVSASGNGNTVSYMYDALGTKLRRISNQQGQREYIGGIEYNGSSIELIHTGEGVAYRNASNNTYSYRFNLTDQLGNVRSTIYFNPNIGYIETLQEDDYFPFGKRYVARGGNNKYLYNGKEMQGELTGGAHLFGSSLSPEGQYDYGARFYDAEIGRWNVVDPLAERFETVSPYNYAINNPILMVDPNGMAADTAKVAWYSQVAEVVVTAMSNMSDFSRLWEIHKTADMYSRRSDGSRDHAGYAGMTLMLDKATGGMGDLMGARAVAGPSSLSRIFKPSKINNLIPKRLARIVPADVNSNTLGAPGAQDVFVTAADDIAGLNASQIADKLTIPKSKSGFLVIEFDTPSVGLSSPINRTNPGFVGFGKTAGGAREFTIPNQVIPAGATKKIVR